MKRVCVVFCLVASSILTQAQIQTTPTTTTTAPSTTAPWQRGDDYLYGSFFAYVARLQQQADEAERTGMNPAYLRTHIQLKSGLNPAQIIALNQIAADLTAQLALYDANATALRQQYHVSVQKNRASGQPPPKPPASLSSIPAGRASLILQARDRLRTTLGDADFTRLATYIRSTPPWKEPAPDALLIKPSIIPLTPDPVAIERNAYKALFQLVRYLNARAEQERKLELVNLADGLQTLVQRQAGLTPEQGKILNRVTTEYFVSLDGYKAQAEAAQLAYKKVCLDLLAREGRITATPEFTTARSALVGVAREADNVTDISVQRLRQELGPEAFAQLDTFAKKRMEPATRANVQGTVPHEVAQ